MTVIKNPTIDDLEVLASQTNAITPPNAVKPPAPTVEAPPPSDKTVRVLEAKIKRLESRVEYFQDVLRHILRKPEAAAEFATEALSEKLYKPLPVVWPDGFTLRDLRSKHLVMLFDTYDLQSEESSGWKYNSMVAKAAITAGWFEEPVGPEFVDNMKPQAVRALARAILRANTNLAADPN